MHPLRGKVQATRRMPPKRGGRSGIGCQVLCFNKRCQRPEKEDALCLLPPSSQPASIAGCIFTVLVSIALPVAALAVLKRKTGRGLLAALVGAGCFIGYALVLEQLLHAAVFSLFPAITLYPAAYTAYGCLAAGLFEETGRLMGLSLLCKKDRDLALGVGYGIGHGGVEAALLAGVNAAVNAAVMLGAPPRRR